MPSSRCRLRKISFSLLLTMSRDWKKLTFYYFADSYINFNPLVTDLFKIYKTRIWMSAINPASFVTPVAGLQLPSGLGPGAFNSESDRYSTTPQQQQHHEPTYSIPGSSAQTQGAFERLWETNPAAGVAPLPFGHIYSQPFQPQDIDNRHMDQLPMEYRMGAGQHATAPQARYHPMPYHLDPSKYGLRPASSTEGIRKTHVLGNDWNQSFQGLSLGS